MSTPPFSSALLLTTTVVLTHVNFAVYSGLNDFQYASVGEQLNISVRTKARLYAAVKVMATMTAHFQRTSYVPSKNRERLGQSILLQDAKGHTRTHGQVVDRRAVPIFWSNVEFQRSAQAPSRVLTLDAYAAAAHKEGQLRKPGHLRYFLIYRQWHVPDVTVRIVLDSRKYSDDRVHC